MKKNKNITVAQALVGGMMLAFTAQSMAQQNPQAGQPPVNPANNPANPATNVGQPVAGDRVVMKGQLNQVGEASKDKVNSTPLQGFADELPLLTVLKQITPNGWIVRKNDTVGHPVNVQKPVSWKGGQTWVNTLGTIASTNNLDIIVDWNENTITVSNSRVIVIPKQEPKVAVFELAGTKKTKDLTTGGSEASNSTGGTLIANAKNGEVGVNASNSSASGNAGLTVAPVVAVVQEPVVAPVINWVMVGSKTLKENVEDWAKKANYRVVWTAVDYPVENRVLTGDFDAENGPIHQLSKDYGLAPKRTNRAGNESRVNQPLSFLIYQNRTLVVEDIQYEQDIEN